MVKVQHWSYRIKKEGERSSSPFFVTLTYDDNNVPYHADDDFFAPTLCKRDLQLYMKRLRKAWSKISDKKLVYYAVGEYGSRTLRPHYHLIMFNCDSKQLINDAWSKGFTSVLPLKQDGVTYVLKYLAKPSLLAKNDLRQREFSLMSKGIGSNHLTPQMIRYHKASPDNCKITLENGVKMSLPRYYKLKVYDRDEMQAIKVHMSKRHIDNSDFLLQKSRFPDRSDDDIWKDLEYRKYFPNVAISPIRTDVL